VRCALCFVLCALCFVLCALCALYREAVATLSPGLPLRLPWVNEMRKGTTATRLRRLVEPVTRATAADATRSGLKKI
jgi:hypothetical protein